MDADLVTTPNDVDNPDTLLFARRLCDFDAGDASEQTSIVMMTAAMIPQFEPVSRIQFQSARWRDDLHLC